MVAAACGPTLPDVRASVRPADLAPRHWPDSERGYKGGEPTVAGVVGSTTLASQSSSRPKSFHRPYILCRWHFLAAVS